MSIRLEQKKPLILATLILFTLTMLLILMPLFIFDSTGPLSLQQIEQQLNSTDTLFLQRIDNTSTTVTTTQLCSSQILQEILQIQQWKPKARLGNIPIHQQQWLMIISDDLTLSIYPKINLIKVSMEEQSLHYRIPDEVGKTLLEKYCTINSCSCYHQ